MRRQSVIRRETSERAGRVLSLFCCVVAALCLSVMAGCGKSEATPEENDEVLVQVGDSVLTRSRVVAQIPSGLTPEDSTRLFDAIVENWLEKYMLSEVAELNVPDIERIDNMVQEYRRQLLANSYRRVMARKHVYSLPEDSVKSYYVSHQKDFLLTEPIVKGVLIKIPANSPHLAGIRKRMSAATPDDIDEIEQNNLNEAVQYDYFLDTWVTWTQITDQIPYQFGKAEDFVKEGLNFETTAHGTTYILHVSEVCNAGETAPFEFAENEVREILSEKVMNEADSQLLHSLYNKGIKNKIIKKGQYVPMKYRDAAGGKSGAK